MCKISHTKSTKKNVTSTQTHTVPSKKYFTDAVGVSFPIAGPKWPLPGSPTFPTCS